MAWAILGFVALCNIILLALLVFRPQKRPLVLLMRLLSDQTGLALIIALSLELIPIIALNDLAIYGGNKQIMFYRLYRAIYLGFLINLILLFINRSIQSLRREPKESDKMH